MQLHLIIYCKFAFVHRSCPLLKYPYNFQVTESLTSCKSGSLISLTLAKKPPRLYDDTCRYWNISSPICSCSLRRFTIFIVLFTHPIVFLPILALPLIPFLSISSNSDLRAATLVYSLWTSTSSGRR